MSQPFDETAPNSSASRLAAIQARIAAAEAAARRPPGSARLIAVSKTFGAEDIRPVLEAGQRLFGENRVQEAQVKWPALKAIHPDTELHLIGPLQSNKSEEAVRLFDVIHTLDRPKLIKTLKAAMDKTGCRPRLLAQVNTGAEPQKAGVLPGDLPALLRGAAEGGLSVEGLMCIPPVDEEPALHFALLAKLAAANGLSHLSMGMSADFESAVKLGATYIRVGSAIFGHRDPAAIQS